MDAIRPEADVFHHQVELDHGKGGVEDHEARDAESHLAGRDAGDGEEGRQHAVDRPGLAAVLGDEPAELHADPGRGENEQSRSQEPAIAVEAAHHREPEGEGEEGDEEQPEADHDPEGPEEGRHMGHGAPGRLLDLLRRGVGDIVGEALQQQGIAEIADMGVEIGPGGAVGGIAADLGQRPIGDHAALDAIGVVGDEFVDAGNDRIDGAGGDQAEHPGNLDGVMGRALGHVGNADDGDGGGRRLRVPHRLDGGDLHLLVLAGEIAALIPQHHDRQRRGEAEARRHGHGALGEARIAALEQEPGADRHDEDRAGDIAGADRMDEFRLGHGIEDDLGEGGELHAHGGGVEFRPDGILHPAIGDQDPERREIGGQRHQPGDGEMTDLRQAVPAEEEEARRRWPRGRRPSAPSMASGAPKMSPT